MFFLPGMTSKRNFPPSSPLDGCSETLFPGRKIVPCGKQRGSFRTQVLVSSFQIRTFCLEQTSKFVRLYVRSRCNTSGRHGLRGIFFQVLKNYSYIYSYVSFSKYSWGPGNGGTLHTGPNFIYSMYQKRPNCFKYTSNFCTCNTAFAFGSRSRTTFPVFSQKNPELSRTPAPTYYRKKNVFKTLTCFVWFSLHRHVYQHLCQPATRALGTGLRDGAEFWWIVAKWQHYGESPFLWLSSVQSDTSSAWPQRPEILRFK